VSGGSTGRPLPSKSCLGKSQDSMGNWQWEDVKSSVFV
jgi:hypothetical protein